MILRLLAIPFTAPIDALSWVADKLVDAAEDRIFDPNVVRQELEAAEARLEKGELSEAEYEEIAAVLIKRLREAQAHLASRDK